MARNQRGPVLFTNLYSAGQFGMLAPYALPVPPYGVIIVEIVYEHYTGKFREVRIDYPPEVREIQPHEIKDV